MTLGIVLGISDAAHAGDRTLDVDGPGFRAWTLIGVIAGLVAVLGTIYLLRSAPRLASKPDDLRDELSSRDKN